MDGCCAKRPSKNCSYSRPLVMTEARWAGTEEDLYTYQLVLRPWLWLLTRTSDCKIFAQMSPIAIIKQVFSYRGFSDFRDETTGSPPTLEYCVQYRETDFNSVCRLMEAYGIYYFFEHEDGKHTLVLADAKSSHQQVPGLSSVPYDPVTDGGRREEQYLDTWSLGRRAQSGVFVLEAVSVILQVASFQLTGKRIFRMSPLHHHFELGGWSESKTIVRFWIAALVFALFSLTTLKLR